MKFCDIVIVNPVIGPKKRGDVKPEVLKEIYNFLIKKYYDNNVIYRPVYANMHYAGPREAVHHALIRERLGFDYFASTGGSGYIEIPSHLCSSSPKLVRN